MPNKIRMPSKITEKVRFRTCFPFGYLLILLLNVASGCSEIRSVAPAESPTAETDRAESLTNETESTPQQP